MSSIVTSPSPSHAKIIREAIDAALVEGLTILTVPDFGVVCISSHVTNRWAKDPRARGVNPLGAVILAAQPEADDPDLAAMQALGVSAAWLEGFTLGLGRAEPLHRWTAHVARHVYSEGYVIGLEIRAVMGSRRRAAPRPSVAT